MRVAARHYRQSVDLPPDLTVDGVSKVLTSVVEQAAPTRGRALVNTDDYEVVGKVFTDAIREVDAGDDIRRVFVKLDLRNGLTFWLHWYDSRYARGFLEVDGPDEPLVLGHAETLRRFMKKVTAEKPQVPSHEEPTSALRRRWWRDLSVEIIGGLIVATLVALTPVIWLIMR